MQSIKPILLCILLLVGTCSFAQKESNNWHFGINAGLDFNVNPPSVTTTGQTNSREGVATISDRTTGQLLFYTEGTRVWNRNHTLMPNGTGLLGDFSSTQSSIAIPKPGTTTHYYLFTTALTQGMYYSEVDMALASGNGDVVAATKNTPLIAGTESSEKLIAVKHCNGVDYWVVTHKLFSSSFVVYLVNATGVQPGVTYNIGATLSNGTGWTGVGYLKFSPTGGRLAHVIGPANSGDPSNVELLNFDNKTGIISGPVVQLTNFNFPYGAEFSPQSRYLYVSENIGRRILQYDLNAANINASKVVINSSPNLNYGALQLGPDGKIYVAAENGYTIGYNFLGRIDNPEGAGTTCNFVSNAVNLGTGRTLIGLPTFAADYLLKDSAFINYTGACAGANGVFSFTSTANVDSVKWNFGDGSAISTQLSPSYAYASANTYNVQLILYKSCSRNDTIIKQVRLTNCTTTQSLCKSSFGYRTTNAIVDIVPAGTGAFSQLYNTNGFTWEAWYRPNGNIINNSLILSTEDAVLFQDIFLGFGYGPTPNALSFMISDDGFANATISAQSTQTFNANTWYHVAAVCDYAAAQLRLYLDGTLVATATIPAGILAHRLSGNRVTQIGNASARASGVNGSIDEVRFWSTVRTQAEIQSNAILCVPMAQTGLVAYFKADENAGFSSKSEVNNNFSATLRSATWSSQVANITCATLSMFDSIADCNHLFVRGLLSGITPAQITQWQWTFGDGGTASTQNADHVYTNAGTYPVKLVITDINGCKDSTTKNITIAVCPNILCKSSFGLNGPGNAIVDIVPAGAGTFSQLYNTNGFTWEAWYRPNGNIINNSLILSTEDAVLFQDIFLGFGYGPTPNALSFMISDNGFANATVAVQSTQTFNANTWYHVAAVCDYTAAQLRLYLNGTLVATATIPAGILAHRLSGNRVTQIGNASARASGVNGSIDEVRFWSTVRTQAEIQNNSILCVPISQTGLVAYFKADENRGLSSKSEVDNNFSASLRNATWSTQVANINCSTLSMFDSIADCNHLFVRGLLLNGITPAQITQWQWTFGDGGTASTQNADHVYTIGGTYPVKLVITDINGCKDSVTKNINIGLLMPEAGRDTTICTNGSVSINLSASGGTNYSWSPAAFLSNAAIANPVATVSSTTKFYVTVTNATPSCSGIDSITITINPVPTVLTNRDTAICRTASLPLVATGAASYVWSPANVVSNPAIANPNFIGTQTQELVVTGTTALGCKSTDTVQITVDTLPVVRTISDTTICNTQTIVLTTSGAQTYQWTPAVFLSNPNAGNPSFTGNASQTYEVVGTDGNGCIGKDTIAITLRLIAAIQAPRDTSICRGETATLNGNNGSGYQYAWSPATGLSNAAIEQPVFNGLLTTPYTLTVSESVCNQQQQFNVLVTVNPLPVINATRTNDINCAQPFSNLRATGALQYNWLPATALSNPTISNPVAMPTATTLFTVKGTDANGCIGYDDVEVKVLDNGKNFTELPNSFTPNGDGLNDCYGPGRFWQNIVSMQFTIYNRWGEPVFYSTSPANCWNGTYKGFKAEGGAYAYHLIVKTECGDVDKKGSVVLIR